MMKNLSSGQSLIEGAFTIFWVVLILFLTLKILITATQNILVEKQLVELLQYDSIDEGSIFANSRPEGDRQINDEDIDVKITIDEFKIPFESERNKIFDGTISKERTFIR